MIRTKKPSGPTFVPVGEIVSRPPWRLGDHIRFLVCVQPRKNLIFTWFPVEITAIVTQVFPRRKAVMVVPV